MSAGILSRFSCRKSQSGSWWCNESETVDKENGVKKLSTFYVCSESVLELGFNIFGLVANIIVNMYMLRIICLDSGNIFTY